jgi:hypothetical protein
MRVTVRGCEHATADASERLDSSGSEYECIAGCQQCERTNHKGSHGPHFSGSNSTIRTLVVSIPRPFCDVSKSSHLAYIDCVVQYDYALLDYKYQYHLYKQVDSNSGGGCDWKGEGPSIHALVFRKGSGYTKKELPRTHTQHNNSSFIGITPAYVKLRIRVATTIRVGQVQLLLSAITHTLSVLLPFGLSFICFLPTTRYGYNVSTATFSTSRFTVIDWKRCAFVMVGNDNGFES